jgi:hypothetical protein
MCNCQFTCWRTAEEIFLWAIDLKRNASITVGVTEYITTNEDNTRQNKTTSTQHNEDKQNTTTKTDETIGVIIDKLKTGARVEL